MNPVSPGLAPLLKLAGELNAVAQHISDGVLCHQDATAVAYVRYELWRAAEHLSYVLEGTWTGEDDTALIAEGRTLMSAQDADAHARAEAMPGEELDRDLVSGITAQLAHLRGQYSDWDTSSEFGALEHALDAWDSYTAEAVEEER